MSEADVNATYYTGCILPSEEELASFPRSTLALRAVEELPSCVDLSANFPTPGNQGAQNSCVGWATAYAYKTFQQKQEHNWQVGTSTHQYSPSYIYNQIHVGKDEGSRIDDAMTILLKQGVCALADMPYNEKDYLTQPNDSQRRAACVYKSSQWNTTNFIGIWDYVAGIKNHLAVGDAVVTAIYVFPSLYNLSPENQIYNNTDHPPDWKGGWHAICLVGYDDSKKSFKFINSWGTNWGVGGFGYISYDLVQQFKCTGYMMRDARDEAVSVKEVAEIIAGLYHHVFALGSDNTLYLNPDARSNWIANWGGSPKFANISALCFDSSPYIFGVGADCHLYCMSRVLDSSTNYNGPWSGWVRDWYNAPLLQGTFTLDGTDAFIFGIGLDNTLYCNMRPFYPPNPQNWTGWGANWNNAPKLKFITGIQTGARVFLFGVGTDGHFYYCHRIGFWGAPWCPWIKDMNNAPPFKSLSGTPWCGNMIFGIGVDNHLYASTSNSTWDGWGPWIKDWNNAPQLQSVTQTGIFGPLLGIGLDNSVYAARHDPYDPSGNMWVKDWNSAPKMSSFCGGFCAGIEHPYIWGIGINNELYRNSGMDKDDWTPFFQV